MARNKLTTKEIAAAKSAVPAWVITDDGRVQRKFEFKSYRAGLEFVNAVGELAEREDHHPDIDFRWGAVSVAFSTHSAGGLTEMDFRLAQLVDKLGR